jgi:diguanylate cyclase (GGDEF)-like protein
MSTCPRTVATPRGTPFLALAAGAWLALFAAGTLATEGHGTFGRLLCNVAYLVPHTLAIVLAIRAARRTTGVYRRLWTMLACVLPLWLAGELVVSYYHVVLLEEPAFPGVADAFFLSFYVGLIVTFLVGLRPALKVRSWKAVLDASVLAVAVAFVGFIIVVEPQLSQAASLASLVGIAYPTLDVAMLTILVSLTIASFRRPPRSLLLLTAAIGVGAVTDVGLTYVSLHTTAPELAWLKIGWETEALLLASAAVAALRGDGPQRSPDEQAHRDRGLTVVLLGVAATLIVSVIHTIGETIALDSGAVAVYVVGAIALRLRLTSAERERISIELEASLREQERIANTDELTGLHNRRFADRHLEARTRARQDDLPLETAVLVLDLDHFKEVNDAHGHPAGDEVLRIAATRLVAAGRPGDVVARYGGEEFVVILHDVDRPTLPAIAERFRAAIAEEPFAIGGEHPLIVTTSVGGASMPADASTLTELLRIADRALYTAKSKGRNRIQIGAHADEDTTEGLIERGSVLNFVQDLVDYIDPGAGAAEQRNQAARWAGMLSDELGLDAGQRWRATAAARLHGIGKIGVPGRPEAGADILSLAPGLRDVAAVVREHQERAEISIEARVVSVCLAWAATHSESDLLAAAGIRLDLRVVETFLSLLARDEDLAVSLS